MKILEVKIMVKKDQNVFDRLIKTQSTQLRKESMNFKIGQQKFNKTKYKNQKE